MDNNSNYTKSNDTYYSEINEDNSDINILAKIKRLQIEESLLLQSLNKCAQTTANNSEEILPSNYSNNREFKDWAVNIKDSFIVVKNLYQEIKTNTNSLEAIQSIDIGDVKTNVLEMEGKIKMLKIYLQGQLSSLKNIERDLNKQITDIPSEIHKIKRQRKVHATTYKEIVPSPVRILMNSPIKCVEVQRFQQFMSSSANRYGGWNEYHHNIFVKIWNKYFKVDNLTEYDEPPRNVEHWEDFEIFLKDLIEKLQGISKDNIISHCVWYAEFIFLKKRQQSAIDKWKTKKLILRKSVSMGQKDELETATEKSCKRSLGDNEDVVLDKTETKCNHLNRINKNQSRTKFDLRKPTEQWINRCNTNDYTIKNINNLECIEKLRTPNWRIGI